MVFQTERFGRVTTSFSGNAVTSLPPAIPVPYLPAVHVGGRNSRVLALHHRYNMLEGLGTEVKNMAGRGLEASALIAFCFVPEITKTTFLYKSVNIVGRDGTKLNQQNKIAIDLEKREVLKLQDTNGKGFGSELKLSSLIRLPSFVKITQFLDKIEKEKGA
ncbi:hypothetical protein ACFE04_016245 [Oxalis oulophora]